jgi:hypothetical protein
MLGSVLLIVVSIEQVYIIGLCFIIWLFAFMWIDIVY